MSLTEPSPQRLRMSWEDYLALPDKPGAEWIDGEVLVTPPVSFHHGGVVMRLGATIMSALPDLIVVTEVGLRLPDNRLRAPDLMAVEVAPTGRWVAEPPVLVVEVLSPATRLEDTVLKSPEYAKGGVGQFWIADLEHGYLDVYDLEDGGWSEEYIHLDDARPTGEVTVGDHGTVQLDLRVIMPRLDT